MTARRTRQKRKLEPDHPAVGLSICGTMLFMPVCRSGLRTSIDSTVASQRSMSVIVTLVDSSGLTVMILITVS